MRKNEKKQPELRFPEFTDDWEQRKYSDVIDLLSGQDFNPNEYNESNNGIPYMTGASCIVNGKTVENRWTTVPRCIAHEGDVLLVCKGSGYGTIARLSQEKAHIARQFMDLQTKEGLNQTFNFYLAHSVVKEIKRDARGLIAGIDRAAVLRQNVIIPSEREQQKIGEYFCSLDRLITLHQCKLEKLKEMKKGVMQKLFSQEVRFKADNGSEFSDWEEKPFGEIVSEFKMKTKTEDEDVLLSCAIGGIFLNSELFGHQRGKSNVGYLKIKKGTLILSAQNLHLGNVNVNMRFEHGIISPAYKTYNVIGCSIEYMNQWVKWDRTKQFFYNATTVGASECRRNVDWNMLYSQNFNLPCLAEQQKIADCLSSLDDVIEKQKATLAAWEEMKKGLLQKMFV